MFGGFMSKILGDRFHNKKSSKKELEVEKLICLTYKEIHKETSLMHAEFVIACGVFILWNKKQQPHFDERISKVIEPIMGKLIKTKDHNPFPLKNNKPNEDIEEWETEIEFVFEKGKIGYAHYGRGGSGPVVMINGEEKIATAVEKDIINKDYDLLKRFKEVKRCARKRAPLHLKDKAQIIIDIVKEKLEKEVK